MKGDLSNVCSENRLPLMPYSSRLSVCLLTRSSRGVSDGKAIIASYLCQRSFLPIYYRVAVTSDVDIITVNGKLPDGDLLAPKVRLALSCSFS